jgi:hypothetical protein
MRGIVLRRQSKQISNLCLMNRGREICAVTGKTNRSRRCNFCKSVSHKVCISTNPIKGTRAEIRNKSFSINNNGKYAPRNLFILRIDGNHAYLGISLSHSFSYTWISCGVPFSPTVAYSSRRVPCHSCQSSPTYIWLVL